MTQTKPVSIKPNQFDREKTSISIQIDDLTVFAKSMRRQLEPRPKHSDMLMMIARAAGYRNYQHLRSRNMPEPTIDFKRVDRAMRVFDGQGRLVFWPGKTSVQSLVLWGIWAAIPPRQIMTEREISDLIDGLSTLSDAAQIRRSMVESKLLTRNRDGSQYQRIERAPTPEARALVAQVSARRKP